MNKCLFVLLPSAGLVFVVVLLTGFHMYPELAIGQQNIEKSNSIRDQNIERSSADTPSAVDEVWREAADKTGKAIDATGRLTAKDRSQIKSREKNKSAHDLFLLRLRVLQELASK